MLFTPEGHSRPHTPAASRRRSFARLTWSGCRPPTWTASRTPCENAAGHLRRRPEDDTQDPSANASGDRAPNETHASGAYPSVWSPPGVEPAPVPVQEGVAGIPGQMTDPVRPGCREPSMSMTCELDLNLYSMGREKEPRKICRRSSHRDLALRERVTGHKHPRGALLPEQSPSFDVAMSTQPVFLHESRVEKSSLHLDIFARGSAADLPLDGRERRRTPFSCPISGRKLH